MRTRVFSIKEYQGDFRILSRRVEAVVVVAVVVVVVAALGSSLY